MRTIPGTYCGDRIGGPQINPPEPEAVACEACGTYGAGERTAGWLCDTCDGTRSRCDNCRAGWLDITTPGDRCEWCGWRPDPSAIVATRGTSRPSTVNTATTLAQFWAEGGEARRVFRLYGWFRDEDYRPRFLRGAAAVLWRGTLQLFDPTYRPWRPCYGPRVYDMRHGSALGWTLRERS